MSPLITCAMSLGPRCAGADVDGGEPNPGADVDGANPVPAPMWAGVSPVPAQMWQHLRQRDRRMGQRHSIPYGPGSHPALHAVRASACANAVEMVMMTMSVNRMNPSE